jgi:glycosyltransferase involved in cell wall biosynthesis
MQIVLCNKYFFLNGGVEKYLYDIINDLPLRGHQAIPFSVRYARTWPSVYQDYFLASPGNPEQAHWGNIRFSPGNIVRFLDRSAYSFEAKIKLNRLLKAVQGADIAYVLNIYNYMSPSILHTFKHHRIPVVMQIGDYNLLCPSYSLLRDGKPCTLCVQGRYYHGLRYRCVKHGLTASAVRVAAMYLHRLLGIHELVDAFTVPCEFMKTKLVEGGFSEEKIHLLRYPVQSSVEMDKAWNKKNYIVFFGRISYEKGIDTLISAFQRIEPPMDLYIIGRSYDGEEERLKGLIEPDVQDRIHFLGFQSGETLSKWIAEAMFSVVPSRWYDNAPLSVYESFQHGTPVIASRIGGIPEQVKEGVNGLLFEPDSCDDLEQKMIWLIANKDQRMQMGTAGHEYVKTALGIKDHMDSLINLFESVIAQDKRR